MGFCMKTTVELPDELLMAAKKFAIEERTTLRAVIEKGLRQQLSRSDRASRKKQPPIRWVTVKGGLPEGLDITDRTKMADWLRHDRT